MPKKLIFRFRHYRSFNSLDFKFTEKRREIESKKKKRSNKRSPRRREMKKRMEENEGWGWGGVQEREGDRTAAHCVGPPGTEGHTLGHMNTHTHTQCSERAHTSACFCPLSHRPALASRRAAPLSHSPAFSLSLSLSAPFYSVFSAARTTLYLSGSHRTAITFIPSTRITSTCWEEEPDSGNTPHFSSNTKAKRKLRSLIIRFD